MEVVCIDLNGFGLEAMIGVDCLAGKSPGGSFDPADEGVKKGLEEFGTAFIHNVPGFIEQRICVADIGLWLLQDRHIEKDKRLPQMMIGAKCA